MTENTDKIALDTTAPIASLRLRTQLVLFGSLAVALIALGFYFFTVGQQRQLFAEEFDKSTLATIEAMRLGLEVGLIEENYENINTVLNWTKKNPDVEFIALVDSNGGIMASYPETLTIAPQQLEAFPPILSLEDSLFVRSGEWTSSFFGKGKVYIGFSTRYIQLLERQTLRHVGIVSLLFLLVSSTGAFLVARGFTRPLERLQQVAEKIARNDLQSRADEEGSLEMVSVARTFNRMLDQLLEQAGRLEEQNRSLGEANQQIEQANRLKSEFLANMSHELRTPLNSVIAMSDILLEKYFGDLTEQQEDYVGDIRDSGHHLLSLINDILDLSKVEAGHSPLEISQVDLGYLLKHSLTIVRERALKHGIELSCELPDDLPDLTADERKVRQIVFNLLSNAVKFTPDGGQVGIRAERRDPGVCISVWDTGIGIAPEDQEKIFRMFEQADSPLTKKFEGSGLGLALVRRFVEQHGGRVWLESEPDKGSRFYFILPLVAPAAPAENLPDLLNA